MTSPVPGLLDREIQCAPSSLDARVCPTVGVAQAADPQRYQAPQGCALAPQTPQQMAKIGDPRNPTQKLFHLNMMFCHT